MSLAVRSVLTVFLAIVANVQINRGICLPHLFYHQVVLLNVVGYRRRRPRPRRPPPPLRPAPLLQISVISPIFSTLLKPISPEDLLMLKPLLSL